MSRSAVGAAGAAGKERTPSEERGTAWPKGPERLPELPGEREPSPKAALAGSPSPWQLGCCTVTQAGKELGTK